MTASMRSHVLLLSSLLAVSALADPPKTTGEEVKKETKEAVDATRRYANEKKEEFEARIEGRVKGLKEDAGQIKAKAKTVAKTDYELTVKDLDEKQKKVDAKLSELHKASAKAWTSLKSGVEGAVDDFEAGVKGAKTK